ncbi:MAG: hypothetical protein CL666_07570 [Balneola sp.]|nr:hypothetical protein [Balneola sp.]|tara:strand:+ start:81548 stop:82048 length:501 start_codon:yes stop_codon:yes gene_type:complete
MFQFLLKYSKIFKNILIKYVWPWFLEHIWPEIKERISELFIYLTGEIFARFKEWMNKRNNETEDTFSSKASEAEQKASEATDQAEIEKQKAIAQVWREAMEMLRRQNEKLEKELEEMREESLNEAKKTASDITLDLTDNEDDKKLTLKIDDSEKPITLPEPTEKDQ